MQCPTKLCSHKYPNKLCSHKYLGLRLSPLAVDFQSNPTNQVSAISFITTAYATGRFRTLITHTSHHSTISLTFRGFIQLATMTTIILVQSPSSDTGRHPFGKFGVSHLSRSIERSTGIHQNHLSNSQAAPENPLTDDGRCCCGEPQLLC